jgi:hypothetical protein
MELEEKTKESEEPKESEEDPDLHPIKSSRSMKTRLMKFKKNVEEEILKFLPVWQSICRSISKRIRKCRSIFIISRMCLFE